MSQEFIQTWELAITPLAPVHIGTGEDFDPTKYVIDGETLYAFSAEAALRVLPEPEQQALLKTVNQTPNVEMIKQVQAFFHRNRERLIPEAEGMMPVLPSIAAEYGDRVGKTAQREESGREIINRLRIERTYCEPASRRPVLPGSSLKGAIRTALLDKINGGRSLTEQERGLKSSQKNRAVQQRLFRYRQFDQDPMRLVQLGDAREPAPSEVYGSEVRYAVNRKRHEVKKDGREIRAQAENLRQVLECIPTLRPRAFAGSINLQDPVRLISPKLPDPELRWAMANLAAACNGFYGPIFKREYAELKSRGYLDPAWQNAVDQVLQSFSVALQNSRAFLLRIGRHSGAQSVTLNGVREIKIMKGRDERPDYLPEAKTFWLAAREIQDRRHLVPFGWVLVECVPVGEHLGPLPTDLADAARAYSGDSAKWWAGVQQRRTDLRTRLDAERKLEEQRCEAEAQEKQEREAREARLQSMSEEERSLEELRVQLASDKTAGRKKAGGPLANKLAETIRDAAEWDAGDREKLASLAEEIYGYIGWSSGAKKKQKKERIDSLRQRGA